MASFSTIEKRAFELFLNGNTFKEVGYIIEVDRCTARNICVKILVTLCKKYNVTTDQKYYLEYYEEDSWYDIRKNNDMWLNRLK